MLMQNFGWNIAFNSHNNSTREFLLTSQLCVYINRLHFLEQFWGHSKIEWKIQRISIYPRTSTHTTTPPGVPHFSTWSSGSPEHWHAEITQSPWFTCAFMLGAVTCYEFQQISNDMYSPLVFTPCKIVSLHSTIDILVLFIA